MGPFDGARQAADRLFRKLHQKAHPFPGPACPVPACPLPATGIAFAGCNVAPRAVNRVAITVTYLGCLASTRLPPCVILAVKLVYQPPEARQPRSLCCLSGHRLDHRHGKAAERRAAAAAVTQMPQNWGGSRRIEHDRRRPPRRNCAVVFTAAREAVLSGRASPSRTCMRRFAATKAETRGSLRCIPSETIFLSPSS
jgi:hypothetical protein